MDQQNHLKLSELNRIISTAITEKFGTSSYWVIADITNHSFKPANQTHYFELVEKDPHSNNIIARISGKAWGNGSVSLSDFEKNTGQRFSNNINVLVLVSIQFHALYGLSLNILDIDTNFTLGILEQQRNATLARLVSQNNYISRHGDQFVTRNNQLELKKVVQKIALLSSSSSAGGEDFKHTLDNNGFGYKFTVDNYFTMVQGDNNSKHFLQRLIEIYNSGIEYDAVVITRGGGAQTDFLIFDNYAIGRAVAKFPIPVITGIGHHKNVTIVDLMAHTQTKTPTKAAEFIIAHNREFEYRILQLQKSIVIRSQQLFLHNFQALSTMKSVVATSARNLVSIEKDNLVAINQVSINRSKSILFNNRRALLNLSAQLTSLPKMRIYNRHNDIKNTVANLSTFTMQFLRNQKGSLDHFSSGIRMMAPENILKKGYAIVKAHNRITSNPNDIGIGDEIDVILSDTLFKTTVNQKSRYDGDDLNL